MKVAVIPARGGSKRIPGKNIKNFCGKPMIAWSILAAVQSNIFDKIIVSTDDEEIAAIAKEYGALVPFERPDNLSDDNTETLPVIAHAIKWLSENNTKPNYVCCIYATAPFISSDDIKKAFYKLIEGSYSYVFSATEYNFPIQRAFKINEDNKVEMFNEDSFSARSQDLEEAYHDAGQFYWGTSDAWSANQIIFGKQSSVILLPKYRTQDIDNKDDWIKAELMFKALVE